MVMWRETLAGQKPELKVPHIDGHHKKLLFS